MSAYLPVTFGVSLSVHPEWPPLVHQGCTCLGETNVKMAANWRLRDERSIFAGHLRAFLQ